MHCAPSEPHESVARPAPLSYGDGIFANASSAAIRADASGGAASAGVCMATWPVVRFRPRKLLRSGDFTTAEPLAKLLRCRRPPGWAGRLLQPWACPVINLDSG